MKDAVHANLTELDTPEASEAHAELIRTKPFLRQNYLSRYAFFKDQLRTVPQGAIIELGSGGGFIREVLPEVITTDVVPLSTTDAALSALNLPFKDRSLSAVLMINVLHHLQDARKFFRESLRCLKPRGKIVMVEPANTIFSRFIYKNFHHEPFLPDAPTWELPQGGRMSAANDALPWIIFCRDRERFASEFPELSLTHCKAIDPLTYLISGGLSRPSLLPAGAYPMVERFERLLSPLHPLCGLFMEIVIERRSL